MKHQLIIEQNISPPNDWYWSIQTTGKSVYEMSDKTFKTSREAIIDAAENSILSTEPPYHVAIIARKK